LVWIDLSLIRSLSRALGTEQTVTLKKEKSLRQSIAREEE